MSKINLTSFPKDRIKVLFLENISDKAVQYFKQQGYQAFHAENELWLGLFGLLLWQPLFESEQSAIYNEFERRPRDLTTPAFYQRLADGSEKQQHDWHDPERVGCMFKITNKASNASLLFAFNASRQAVELNLPQRPWQLLFDTSVDKGMAQRQSITLQRYQQNAHSISVWL